MASYKSQSDLVGNQAYRLRVRACLLEEATTKPPGWDAVFADIHNLEERAVTRLAPLHAAAYDSGVATGLAEPSSNITDGDILSGVQAYWWEITQTAEPAGLQVQPV
jgi:hypothetical protein